MNQSVSDCLSSGDIRHLHNPIVRLLIRRAIGADITPVLAELDESELIDLQRNLCDHGGAYWRDVVELIHNRLSPPTRSHYSSGANLFDNAKASVQLEEFAARFTDFSSASGGRLRGRCPLHDERTPSFVIYLDSQRWHCYGACGTGGDVIELARRLMDAGKW